jgi:hypothetical protein
VFEARHLGTRPRYRRRIEIGGDHTGLVAGLRQHLAPRID